MKKNLYLMYAIALLQGMVFYGPIATLYRQAQGVSVFQITLIEGISLALCIALEIPWGVIADKIGYRRTMISCCLLYFVSKIVFWRATGFVWFLVERCMLSVVLSGFSGVDSCMIYLSCKPQESQRAFGIYNGMGMIGLLIASAVFSVLVKENYSLAGFLTVLSYGVAGLLSFGLTEVKQEEAATDRKRLSGTVIHEIIKNHRLLLFLAAAALLTETHQTITVFLNQLQYSRCGLGDSAIGVIYMIATLLGICGIWSARFRKKIGTRRCLILFSVTAAASCGTLAFCRQALPSVLGILTLRIVNSLFQPFQSEILNRQIRTKNRATALSICAMIMDGIAIGTNLVFGALSEITLPIAFLFGAGINILGLCLFLQWHRNENSVE